MPTSWNVTPHRDEHGYPATMTGDDGMEVLDLDMELDEHALRVFQLHSQPWLKARLQFYKEKSDALWRRRRNGSRHRNRVAQNLCGEEADEAARVVDLLLDMGGDPNIAMANNVTPARDRHA